MENAIATVMSLSTVPWERIGTSDESRKEHLSGGKAVSIDSGNGVEVTYVTSQPLDVTEQSVTLPFESAHINVAKDEVLSPEPDEKSIE